MSQKNINPTKIYGSYGKTSPGLSGQQSQKPNTSRRFQKNTQHKEGKADQQQETSKGGPLANHLTQQEENYLS
jgi:hypothetical protein